MLFQQAQHFKYIFKTKNTQEFQIIPQEENIISVNNIPLNNSFG